MVLDAAQWNDFPARQEAARREGRYIGIGLAHGIKGTGRGPFESGVVRVSNTGRVTVFTGAAAIGQGLQTALAQITADELGLRADEITVVPGDTAGVALGLGAFASRQMVTAGTSVLLAARVVAGKAKKLASHILEAGEHDLELKDGEVRVVGAPQLSVSSPSRASSRARPAMDPPGVEPGLGPTSVAHRLPHLPTPPCRRVRSISDRRRAYLEYYALRTQHADQSAM
jgi:carbon-monoxide dehydrogenase large subunit